MAISSWLVPVLWREHDWRAALDRLATELTRVEHGAPAQRAALELARASEYIEPDRGHAIAAYELAGIGGDLPRATELAIELGWWAVRARLSATAFGATQDPRARLDEAEAWWDAGQPRLAAFALAGVRGAAREPRGGEIAALLAGRDASAVAMARAAVATGDSPAAAAEAADAYVMAARFSRAGGRGPEAIARFEQALARAPGHGVASRFLLSYALENRDPERMKRFLRLRLDTLELPARLDAMRACAVAMTSSGHNRGFGLRLLRQTLELAYDAGRDHLPGHLAMWALLVSNASSDGTRRELLPLAITALQSTQHVVDRVWLGVLATEISLRDANNPVVAGAYAEVVAEYAPEHPIVRELVANVAAGPGPGTAEARRSRETTPVPVAAVAAATAAQAEAAGADDIQIDLDEVYAGAAAAAETAEPPRPTEPDPMRVTTPIKLIEHAAPPPVPKPSTTKPLARVATPAASTAPLPKSPSPSPTPSPSPSPSPTPSPSRSPKLVPPIAVTKPLARIAPPKPAPAATTAAAAPSTVVGLPSLSRALPVLAALRTPDRPLLPPPPPTRPDALPRARRISIPIDVTLILADGSFHTGHSRDVSATGLFVLTIAQLAIGTELAIELLLPGKEAFTEDTYRARARVARRADAGYGLELIDADAALRAALEAL